MGVPYRGVVALFVGFADLIPLVGATLGAVVAIAVAALHSLPAAIVVLVVFVVYQQLENHVLQPVIMSRTVQLSALTVLVSILIEVELPGSSGRCSPSRSPESSMSSAATSRQLPGPPQARTTTGTDQIPVSQPRPPEPASNNPATSPPPPPTADPIGPATQPTRHPDIPGRAHRTTGSTDAGGSHGPR